jgi:hypothetical protein
VHCDGLGRCHRNDRKLGKPDEFGIGALQSSLELAGAVFLQDGDHGGAGVPPKFNGSKTRRIATPEGEGGLVDDVP